MISPGNLINTSAQDANILLDIQVARDPLAALELVSSTFQQLAESDNPRATLRKALARAGRNALKQLQTQTKNTPTGA
jgi:hypothetical protein